MANMPKRFGGQVSSEAALRVLCYGDSLTAGFAAGGLMFEPYGRTLAERLNKDGSCEVFVCGHSGKKASEMVAAAETSLVDVCKLQGKGLARILREDGPFDLVLIMAGTNDMGSGASDQAVVDDLRRLHRICHAAGVATVAVAPPPAPCAGAPREALRQRLARHISKELGSMDGVALCVDPAKFVAMGDGKMWDRDGLHFSPEGSKALGAGLATIAKQHSSAAPQRDARARAHGTPSASRVHSAEPQSATPLADFFQRIVMTL